MRKALLVAFLLAVAVFAGWKYAEFKKAPAAAGKESYRLLPVTRGSIKEDVTAQGKLEPKEYVDVGTQVSGQLKKIHVEIGDTVKAGQLLVEIDPRIYEARVTADEARIKTLRAQVTEQEAALALAQQQYNRNKLLIKSNAVSRDALEQAEQALKASKAKGAALKAEIEEAQSTLDGDKTNLAYTKISAPMAGTVVDLPMREGQTVNATQSAPTILRIANLDVMTVRAQVAEADVMRLKEGMPAYFTTMGQMDRRWTATVRQILPTPEIINNVVLYNVLIDSPNPDHQLMTSMSTQVFFDVGSAEDVLLIPAEALTKRDTKSDNEQGSAYIVKVMRNGQPQEQLIHIGLLSRTQAEVRTGLAEGDQIVMPPVAVKPAMNTGGPGMRGPRL